MTGTKRERRLAQCALALQPQILPHNTVTCSLVHALLHFTSSGTNSEMVCPEVNSVPSPTHPPTITLLHSSCSGQYNTHTAHKSITHERACPHTHHPELPAPALFSQPCWPSLMWGSLRISGQQISIPPDNGSRPSQLPPPVLSFSNKTHRKAEKRMGVLPSHPLPLATLGTRQTHVSVMPLPHHSRVPNVPQLSLALLLSKLTSCGQLCCLFSTALTELGSC